MKIPSIAVTERPFPLRMSTWTSKIVLKSACEVVRITGRDVLIILITQGIKKLFT